MKQVLLLSLNLVVFVLSGFAQPVPITLTVNDVANAGEFVVNTTIPFSGGTPATGSAQTYDLSAAGYSPLQDTTFYIPAAGTPFASEMTGANICQRGPGSYTYFVRNNGGFYLKGFVFEIPADSSFIALPSELVFAFSPQIPIMTFPATMGMNLITSSTSSRVEIPFDTTIVINGVSTTIKKIGVKLNIKDTSKIDGWGTATFPSPGSTFNVLRNTHNIGLETTLELYIILFGNIGTWIPMPSSLIPAGLGDFLGGNTRDVMLWTNGRKQPLVTMSLDTLGNVGSAEFQSDLLADPTRISPVAENTFVFYPNPAAGSVLFDLPSDARKIIVRDFSGRLVIEQEINNPQSNLSTAALSDGVYHLELIRASGSSLRKKLVIRH